MQVEAGQGLQHWRLPDEDRYAVPARRRDDIGEVDQPALPHEERPGPVTGGKRAANDFLRLGDVEPAFGLGPATQRHVGQSDVVSQARIIGRVDPGDPRREGSVAAVNHGNHTILTIATTPTTTMIARRTGAGSLRPRCAPINPPSSEPTAIRATTTQST